MPPQPRSRLATFALCGIVLGCLLVASVWLVRVPFFAEPDENAHADYALTIWSAGRPIAAREHPVDFNVSPFERELARGGAMDAVRFDPGGRVPRAYGSAAYLHDVDRRGAALDPGWYGRTRSLPYLVAVYPLGFYALEAIVFGVAHALSGSLVAGFFAMRGLCIALLAVALVICYGIARELRVRRGTALVVVASIGLFPVVDLSFAYIQPDDLAATLFFAGIYVALRVRRLGATPARALGLGVLLALEVLVKPHDAVALGVATLPVLAFAARRPSRSRAMLLAAAALLPAAPAYVLSHALESGGSSPFTYGTFASSFLARPVPEILRHALVDATSTIRDLYSVNSLTFDTFYHALSTTATRISLGSRLADELLDVALQGLTLLVLVVVGARLMRNIRRLGAIARRRSPRTAFELASRNVPLNAYVAYVGTLVLAEIYLQSGLFIEGRYLVLVVPSTALLFAREFPRALPRRAIPAVARGAAATMLAYSAALAVAGIVAIGSRWYGPPGVFSATHEYAFEIDPQAGRRGDDARAVPRGEPYVLTGWVIDSHRSEPAAVRARLDGRAPLRVRSRIDRIEAVGDFADGRLLASGFAISIDTARLSGGAHRVDLVAIEAGRDVPDAGGPIAFDVVDPARARP